MNNSTGLAIALLAFLGLGALGLGAFLVATTRQSQGTNNLPSSPTGAVVGQPVTPAPVTGKVVYENEERTKITWNSEGFPVEIVTTRHVEQLPW